MSHSQKSCCVPGCSNEQGVQLHHFPCPEMDIERFRTWVMRIGGEIIGLENMYIFKNRRVCSRHFEPIYKYARKLSRTAIPTLHLGSHFTLVQTQRGQADFASVPQQDEAIPGTSQQNLGVAHIHDIDLPAQPMALEPVPLQQSAKSRNSTGKTKTYVTHIKFTQEEMDLQKFVWKTEQRLQRSETMNVNLRKKVMAMKKIIKTEAFNNISKHWRPVWRNG